MGDSPTESPIQHVSVDSFTNGAGDILQKIKLGMWGIAISLAGMIFAMGSFYGHSLSTETEIRAALAAGADDRIELSAGVLSISETMGSVVAEQQALRRDVERLRDGVN